MLRCVLMIFTKIAREALEDRGYRVIVIRFDWPLERQVGQHLDIFGLGIDETVLSDRYSMSLLD